MNTIGISGLHNSVDFKKREFPNLSSRTYRIAQGFDSAAALVRGGEIVAAAAEERFSGEKATGAFPVHAIQYCLQAGHLKPEQVDHLAHGFCYEPFKEFFDEDEYRRKQYREVYSAEVQRGLLEQHFPGVRWGEKLIPVPHHVAHAASAFYPSGFDEALVLVSDGMGEIQLDGGSWRGSGTSDSPTNPRAPFPGHAVRGVHLVSRFLHGAGRIQGDGVGAIWKSAPLL
jgi:carbamoyltransferase